MPFLFFIFAALTLIGGIGVVVNRTPVTSAFSMIVSVLGLAALFIQLNAYLVGVLQVLVYAGAIMVLFLFIIMLLDIPKAENKRFPVFTLGASVVVVVSFVTLVITVITKSGVGAAKLPAIEAQKGPGNSAVHQIGELLFSTYWFPVQIVAVLLLVSTVGVVVLSKRELK